MHILFAYSLNYKIIIYKMLQIACSTKFYFGKIAIKHKFYAKTMNLNEDTLRKRLYAFQEIHSDKADSFTIKHFQEEGVPRSSHSKNTLKNKRSIRKRKNTKTSNRTTAQKEKIRMLCRQLYLKYKDFVWILDDESYFCLT